MKIGFYVQRVAGAPGFEDVVSAHVQLPLHTMALLRAAGHDVQLITTEFGQGHTLPNCLPPGVTVHQVTYASRQSTHLIMHVGTKKGIRPLLLVKQLYQLKSIVEDELYDVLHLFGSHRLAYLARGLKLIGISVPLVLTVDSGQLSRRPWPGSQQLWRSFASVITSTDFFRRRLADHGIEAHTIRHGVVRDMEREVREMRAHCHQRRVLFWRDPSIDNGADVCLQVYEQLAPRFPFVSFDLAVRPHWNPVAGLRELAERYPNVNLYEFPYRQGITIARLLAESICVLLPFRRLNTHPQFAVLESMRAGCAVITTDIDSNPELIDPGRTGYLVPAGDVPATVMAVEQLLSNPKHAARLAENASQALRTRWNWTSYMSKLVEVYDCAVANEPYRQGVDF